MSQVQFFKVTTLPGTLQANSFYLVENGNYAETYVTNSAGVAKMVGNSVMINALIDAKVNTAVADMNLIEIVADITARDAFVVGKTRNLLILVTDASADATVDSGSALYSWAETGGVFTKLAEYESMDFAVSWANISGKPTSSPAQIDNAVSLAHSHTNKTQLDKIGENGNGNLTYNGTEVGAW